LHSEKNFCAISLIYASQMYHAPKNQKLYPSCLTSGGCIPTRNLAVNDLYQNECKMILEPLYCPHNVSLSQTLDHCFPLLIIFEVRLSLKTSVLHLLIIICLCLRMTLNTIFGCSFRQSKPGSMLTGRCPKFWRSIREDGRNCRRTDVSR